MSGLEEADKNDNSTPPLPFPSRIMDLPLRLAAEFPMRQRSDSLRSGMSSSLSSVLRVPQNTPVTPSVAGAAAPNSNDQIAQPHRLFEHLERAEEDNPGRFWEHDTIAPENTPASGSPTSHYRPQAINLPRIDESLDQLPPPASSQHSSTPASTSDSQRKSGKKVRFAVPEVASNRTEIASAGRCVQLGATKLPPSPLGIEGKRTPATPENVRGGIGVREHTDWHDDVESDMSRGLARLANLADDDHQSDPSKTAEEYYRARLDLLLNDRNLKFAFGSVGVPPILSTGGPAVSNSPLSPADRVTGYQFRQLVAKVDGINDRLNKIGETQDRQLEDTKQILNQLKRHADEIEDLKRHVHNNRKDDLPRSDSTVTMIHRNGDN